MSVASTVNVLAELERLGIKPVWCGEEEIRVLCPFHELDGKEHDPSGTINVKKRVFKCRTAGCEKQGDFITYLSAYTKHPRSHLIFELGKRYGVMDDKLIDPSVVERAHQDIWTAKGMLAELYKRGVTDELIRYKRYGYDGERITIPVKNEEGLYVNIRRYMPGAAGRKKMMNVRGHGQPRIYPIEQMKYDRILFCGGELKADVAALQLNPHGIGAVTITSGEGNFDVELLPKFAGKDVYICLDIDHAGRSASELRARQFYNVANEVYTPIQLPLDSTKYPTGDINDFIGLEAGELLPLIETATVWRPANEPTGKDEAPVELSLVDATNAKAAGQRVKVKAIVSAMAEAPYIVPKKVLVKCDKSQKICAVCPVWSAHKPEFDIHPESPAILQMVAASKKSVREGLHEALGVPKQCPVVEFEASEYYNVEETRISPQLEITNRSADRVMQPALCIGEHGVELNESFELTGRLYPHPQTQQSTLLISNYKATQDALQSYQCRDLDRLMVFRPKGWTVEALQEKLDEIYADFEANVTRIYQRRKIHLAVDLAYHSPLLLSFDGKNNINGWVQMLIVGDSSQGKSEVTCGSNGKGGLMAHYRLGEKVDCKNASVAGLLGGLAQMGTRWFVSWGVIPTHDKRLVILEELKGANPEVIARLTDMRSSGVAEIPKIEKKRTHARTRLIANSNTRPGSPIHTYSFGIEAIKELIGALEDIRRFDAAVIVSSTEVDENVINQLASNRPKIEHVYAGELCRSLILWAWTRPGDKVIFDDDATKATLEEASRMCKKYTETIPLIDRGSARYKIARLAAALAARTFSSDDIDHETIVVRECHVRYVVKWLDEMYSSSVFGYKDYSDAMRINEEIVDPDKVKHYIEELPFPGDFVKNILRANRIDQQDIMDWTGWERQDAMELQSFLVRKHALKRDGRVYRKTAPFIDLLKSMLESGGLMDRPDFIKEPEY